MKKNKKLYQTGTKFHWFWKKYYKLMVLIRGLGASCSLWLRS